MSTIGRWLRRLLHRGPRITESRCWDLSDCIAQIPPFDARLLREFRGEPSKGIVHRWEGLP